jgi:hypothetical protein
MVSGVLFNRMHLCLLCVRVWICLLSFSLLSNGVVLAHRASDRLTDWLGVGMWMWSPNRAGPAW